MARTWIRAEDIKLWLAGAKAEEKLQRTGEPPGGLGDRWQVFAKLLQAVWERDEIPHQIRWIAVVLIPKGGGDYRGIGLMEPIWKVMEIVMIERM